MKSESPSTRIERLLEEARAARMTGATAEAASALDAAAALYGQGPVRRELRVAVQWERGLTAVVRDEPQRAREALGHALELTGDEATLADPVRADLATVELMAGEPRRAQARLTQRGRDRRATLVAQARLRLWEGATDAAEQALQACEQAPGGASDLHPPAPALRCLVALWEGRTEAARLLFEGVATEGAFAWTLLRALLLRRLWVESGDGRYLELALAHVEQARFSRRPGAAPGSGAAISAIHALLLSLTGQQTLALEAADEALGQLGALTLPEWPRAAILHDLAVVYRDAGRLDSWRAVLESWAATPTAGWLDRMALVTGPRATGATTPATEGPAQRAAAIFTEAALRVVSERHDPEAALLRALTEEVGASGGRWTDGQGRTIAATGTSLVADTGLELGVRLPLKGGGVMCLEGISDAAAAALDVTQVQRLADAARKAAQDRAREARLRDALEVADARRREAEGALERNRRGAASAVVGGRFPAVAGHSAALREVLDRLALLAPTDLPVLLDGPSGAGRRHLARALAVHLGVDPDRCPVLDMSLVPAETMTSTLLRLEAEAALVGLQVIAHAEHLTPDAASWLIARLSAGGARARVVLTLDGDMRGPVADALRAAFAAGRVDVPGLGERLEDLPDLIDALVVALGRRPADVGTAARAVLARRVWSGHVAELRTLLAQAIVRAGERGAIVPEHLEPTADEASTRLSESLDLGYHDAVRSFRQQLLRHALSTTGGNRTRAAELLGVQRTYFMRLIRDLEADDIPAP